MTTGLVTQSIVIDFHDWIGGAGSEILDTLESGTSRPKMRLVGGASK